LLNLSNHPSKYKINTLSNLIQRDINIADSRYLEDVKKEIFNIVIDNCYPLKLIKRLWFQIKGTKHCPTNNSNTSIIDDNVTSLVNIEPSTSIETSIINSQQHQDTKKMTIKEEEEEAGAEKKEEGEEEKTYYANRNSNQGKSMNNTSPQETCMSKKNGQPHRNTTKNVINKQQASTKFASVTYVNSLSQKVVKDLKDYDLNNIKYAYKPINKLNRIYSNMKDNIPEVDKKNVVYKVFCKDCDSFYIGQTGQTVKERMTNHAYTCNKNSKNKTALSEHAVEKTHKFDLEHPSILYEVKQKGRRQVVEGICITKNIKKAVNYKTDIGVVGTFYSAVIDRLKIPTGKQR